VATHLLTQEGHHHTITEYIAEAGEALEDASVEEAEGLLQRILSSNVCWLCAPGHLRNGIPSFVRSFCNDWHIFIANYLLYSRSCHQQLHPKSTISSNLDPSHSLKAPHFSM